MSLQKLLNYRDICPVCHTLLTLESSDLADIRFTIKDDSLHVNTGLKEMSIIFRFDGTYEKMKKWNNLYIKPFSLIKKCNSCKPHKYRSIGASALTIKYYYYSFDLWGDDNQNYKSHMNSEEIKFSNEDNLYQIKNNYERNTSQLMCTKNGTPFLREFPIINLANIVSQNQIIDKINMYKVFS